MQKERYSSFLVSLGFALIISTPLFSQFNTYSPYTRFALGDLARHGVAQNQAMGGSGLAMHEGNRINFLNPASFAALDSTSVYFDFGANSFHNQYETRNYSNSWWNMNLHHVAFASSMGKYLGFSAGIVPYSSVGYNIKQEYDDFTHGLAMDTYFEGEGGIINFYMGTSVKLLDRLSLGVTMNYLMGKLTRERAVNFPMNSSYSDVTSTENLNLRKPVFTLGLQYREVFGYKFFFTVGGIYDFKAGTEIANEYLIHNEFYPDDPVWINDSVQIDPVYILGEDTAYNTLSIPQKMGVGIAFGIPDKLTITGDYYIQDWSGSMSGENYSTTRATSMHFGAEYTPDVEAIRGYHKLMSYRLGGYYSNSYLMVNEQQLQDYGITFGVGLPVKTLRSSLNVAFTLGTRGTTEYNLVKENYGIITFNVTLHDLWFRKRRFD
ncbi:MAG: hypothetical protein P1P86_07400 [Bacteroidales bacterium]|nr:hypothetical protein [Bacteroidales bacterium]